MSNFDFMKSQAPLFYAELLLKRRFFVAILSINLNSHPYNFSFCRSFFDKILFAWRKGLRDDDITVATCNHRASCHGVSNASKTSMYVHSFYQRCFYKSVMLDVFMKLNPSWTEIKWNLRNPISLEITFRCVIHEATAVSVTLTFPCRW